MFRKTLYSALFMIAIVALCNYQTAQAQEGYPQQGYQQQGQGYPQQGYGRQYAPRTTTQDNERFMHYPYVYYPQNFWSQEYYRSGQDVYNRYPTEMQIPAYNPRWHNFYPEQKRYHMGHHFYLDVM